MYRGQTTEHQRLAASVPTGLRRRSELYVDSACAICAPRAPAFAACPWRVVRAEVRAGTGDGGFLGTWGLGGLGGGGEKRRVSLVCRVGFR